MASRNIFILRSFVHDKVISLMYKWYKIHAYHCCSFLNANSDIHDTGCHFAGDSNMIHLFLMIPINIVGNDAFQPQFLIQQDS